MPAMISPLLQAYLRMRQGQGVVPAAAASFLPPPAGQVADAVSPTISSIMGGGLPPPMPGDSPNAGNIIPSDFTDEERPGMMAPPPQFSTSMEVNASAPPAAGPDTPPFMQPPMSMGAQRNAPIPGMVPPDQGSLAAPLGKSDSEGGFPWGKILAALGVAGLGGLAAKRGALTEALAGLGKGFAGEKYRQIKEKRDRDFQQESFLIEQAHKAAMEFRDVTPADLASAPPVVAERLKALSDKYVAALGKDSPGGKALTPQEATEITALWNSIRGEVMQSKERAGLERKAETERQIKERQGIADVRSMLPTEENVPGRMGPLPSGAALEPNRLIPPPELDQQARDLYQARRRAEFESTMPVMYQGRMIPRKEAMELEKLASAEERERLRLEAAEARERQRDARWEATQRSIQSRFDASDARQRESMNNQLANALRDDYRQEIKPFQGYTIHVKKLKALWKELGKPTGPADLAFVQTFLKLLDDNAVREHETKMAADLGSWRQKINATLAKWKKGTILEPSLRNEYMAVVQQIAGALDETKKEIDDEYSFRATQSGIEPYMVVKGAVRDTSLSPPPGAPRTAEEYLKGVQP